MITAPAVTAFRPPSPLLDRLPLLAAGEAGQVRSVLTARGLGGSAADGGLEELTRYYFGETADRASTARFLAAVETCYALAASTP